MGNGYALIEGPQCQTKRQLRVEIPGSVQGWGKTDNYVTGLTIQVLMPTATLVQIACKPSTIGLSHLISLGSPFLNSSNATACFSNIANTSSGERQQSIMAVSGWSERACPVRLEYLVKAASKSVSKLKEDNVVSSVNDITLTGGMNLLRGMGEITTAEPLRDKPT